MTSSSSFISFLTRALFVGACACLAAACATPEAGADAAPDSSADAALDSSADAAPEPGPPQDYFGAPFTARPLAPKNVWEHPTYGDGTTFSTTMHSDHYNSDVMPFPGPLGHNPVVTFQDMGLDLGGICSTPRFTAAGNIVVPCQDGPLFDRQRKLVLMDQNMNPIAESPPGVWVGAGNASTAVPGGAYPHVRSDGSVLNGSAEMEVELFTVSGDEYVRTVIRDLSAASPGDSLFEVAEDGAGHLWFITVGAGDDVPGVVVGYIEAGDWSSTAIHTFPALAGEAIENGFAIGENGTFVLSDTKLYGFGIGAGGDVVKNWEYAYDVTSVPRPEFISLGSGSTTTLLGDDLIAITDNAAGHVNLVVMRREAGAYATAEDRIVCKVPLFENDASAVDVSPIGYDDGLGHVSLIVTNWTGVDPPSMLGGVPIPPIFGDMSNMVGGMSRYDVNGRNPGDGCTLNWHRPEVAYTTVAKLSTATGLIYTYTQDRTYEDANAYYFEAIDFETGETAFRKLSGYEDGGLMATNFYNGMFTLAIGPNGAVYQGVFGGMVMLEDE